MAACDHCPPLDHHHHNHNNNNNNNDNQRRPYCPGGAAAAGSVQHHHHRYMNVGCGHCIECCDEVLYQELLVGPLFLEIPSSLKSLARRARQGPHHDEWQLRSGTQGYLQGVEFRPTCESEDVSPSKCRLRRGLAPLQPLRLPRKCTNVDPKQGAEVLLAAGGHYDRTAHHHEYAVAAAGKANSANTRCKRLRDAASFQGACAPRPMSYATAVAGPINPAMGWPAANNAALLAGVQQHQEQERHLRHQATSPRFLRDLLRASAADCPSSCPLQLREGKAPAQQGLQHFSPPSVLENPMAMVPSHEAPKKRFVRAYNAERGWL